MIEEKQWISSEVLFFAIEEMFNENKCAVFTVTGMSMWPFLCHGRDQVVIESCVFEDLKKGDVVLLKTLSGKYLLHRVTSIKEQSFETTGDGNCFRDGYFSAACLKARVVKMVRKGKNIDCQSIVWRLVFKIWVLLFPIRPLLLMILRKISQ